MIQMGELIKKARKQRGYTQEELAMMSGFCARSVRRWENGHVEPSFFNAQVCLESMGCSLENAILMEAA